jgi:hypothetical protein
MKMLFRPHRGTLDDAMLECISVSSLDEVWQNVDIGKYGIKKKMKIEYYCYDERIKLETYIITNEGWGVVGFSNGLLPQLSDNSDTIRH